MLTPPHITVFGGTGFIGRHVVRHLARTGAVIHVPTRTTDKALFLKTMGTTGQIIPVPYALHHDQSVARAIGTSRYVINLLGILYEKQNQTFQSIHVEAAARIARLANRAGASHLIHMSALGADPSSPSLYARSKAAGEQAVLSFFPQATMIRPSIVYGAEDSFFNRFARLAKHSPFMPLIGGGHTKFQPIYVGDVAKAITALIHRSTASNREIYAFGGDEIFTFRELMAQLLDTMGVHRPFLNISWPAAYAQAFMLEHLPIPPLTRDQVRLLKTDNIVPKDSAHLSIHDLGIMPTRLQSILPHYS